MTYIELRVIEGEPDAERRCCAECRHCKAAGCWWCTNEDAVKWRGTSVPGIKNCQFWEPALPLEPPKPWWKRMFLLSEANPILIRCKVKKDATKSN